MSDSTHSKFTSPSQFKAYTKYLYRKAEIPAVKPQKECSLPVYKYLQSAQGMATKITMMHDSLSTEQSYILKLRFVLLYLNVLKKHRFWMSNSYEYGRNFCKMHANKYLEEIENLKKKKLIDFFGDLCERNKNRKLKKEGEKDDVPGYMEVMTPTVGKKITFPGGFRKVSLNQRLIDEFLNHAFFHLEKNIEFCGILCGKLKNNEFVMTHCLLPEQEGTENSVNCLNEMDLFNYQMKYDLLTLGWIHIHPTQTAFLSSIDLATHFGYQQMLRESIAIVCAPKRTPKQGIFRIQDSCMDIMERAIKQNPNIGNTFCKIGDRKLFEDCNNCICNYENGVEFKVVDLRKNKKINYSKGFRPGMSSSGSTGGSIGGSIGPVKDVGAGYEPGKYFHDQKSFYPKL